jgi:RTX calcium-binding nonapeptide repeat (4 copies)
MRFGTGKAPRGALFAFALALTMGVPSPAAAAGGISSAVTAPHGAGARATAGVNFLTIGGTPTANRISAYIAPATGRLTLTAPEGISPPAGSGNCVSESPTQFSCDPGFIQVIVGELGAGDDNFDAADGLPVALGVVVNGERRPLSGGIGHDRIVGGALADLLDGGGGPDSLVGTDGDDLLSGGGGADRLNGGLALDVLYGGGGDDNLNGGPARDLCMGGVGRDLGKSCKLSKSIP